ncbi:MAG: hypothetical protein P8R37_02370 [Opitutae bacterium]|nr:hypothetical protein [Opitutae bacterium]
MPPSSLSRKQEPSGGFALVIALSLMAFVLLLLLSITTLVQVESQSAAIHVDQLQAEQAALLSLNIAIGKLQATAGLDQRVTASAEAVDSVNGPKQLTGVWRSWEGLDHQANGFPIAPDYDSKLVTGDFDLDVSSSGSGRFLSWLVSTAHDEFITPAGSLSADATPAIEEVPGRTVPLVGKGSVGTDDAAYATANEVHLEPTALADGSAAIAWWISGENTKSSLSQPTVPTDVLGWAERLTSSTRPDTSVFDITESNELDRVASRASLDQLSSRGTNELPASKEYFHDLTNYSRGLLTNTATGGWRRDLSLLSEQWADVSTEDFDPKGLPMFTLQPGVQTAVRKGGDDVASDGALIYPWAVESKFPGPQSQEINGGASTSWDALVDFSTQYKKILSGDASGQVLFPSDSLPARDECSRSLLITRIHWIFSFSSREVPDPDDPDGSSKYVPYLSVSPVLTVWNPHSVALDGFNAGIQMKLLNPIPYKFRFSVDGTRLDPNFQTLPDLAGSNLLFFAIKKDLTTWKPGETRFYSMDRDYGSNVSRYKSGYRTDTGYEYKLSNDSYSSGASFRVELEEFAEAGFLLKGDSTNSPMDVSHGTTIDPSAVARFLPEDLEMTNISQKIQYVAPDVDGKQNSPFFIAVMQMRGIFERSNDALGYAHTKPILRLSSNQAAVGGGGELEYPEAYPFEWLFYAAHDVNSDELPQEGPEGSSLIGTSFKTGLGLSHLAVAEIPTRPLRSLGELQHFDINYNNPRPPYTAHPIGNSLASYLIDPDNVAISGMLSESTATSLDHSYISNHLLYDDWFVSSIAPKTAPFSSAEVRSVEQIYEAFVSGLEPLPNSAYVAAEPLSVAAASTAASDLIDDSTSWHSVASKLEVDGMFNINSTSVAAWTALLKHADGDDVPYNSVDLENNWSVKLEKSADASGSPVSRTSLAGYPKANPDSDIQKIGRHQRLSDAQVRALATEIVEQVKARGPFLSLSEFMNRRLSSDRSLARSGAVEAALNELASRGAGASENPFSGIQSYFTGTVTIPDGVTYPFEEAAEGNLAYGFPGWMRQADVLSPIAPILSARDDTFVIRAYGECKDPLTGDAKAGAWCEAVLQRRADYVDSINDEAITLPSESTLTSEINKRFGRRFVIVSFRWLAADEV